MSDLSTPVQISFDRLHCVRETSEAGSDDPYVLFSVTDLTQIPYPTVVQLTDTFSMGEGDTARQGQGQNGNRRRLKLLWGPDGHQPRAIRSANDVLILVALIESDSGPDGALMVQNAAQASMAGNVLALKSAGLSRHDLAQKLIENLYGAISLGARPGGIAFYDACLGIGEFSLAQRSQSGTNSRLETARVHGLDEKVVLGRGHGTVVRGEDISQGALYEVHLRLGPVPN
jgi:hypothetical protein